MCAYIYIPWSHTSETRTTFYALLSVTLFAINWNWTTICTQVTPIAKRHSYRYYPHCCRFPKVPLFFVCSLNDGIDGSSTRYFSHVQGPCSFARRYFTEVVHRCGCLTITICIAVSVCKLYFQLSTHGTSSVHLIGCAHGYWPMFMYLIVCIHINIPLIVEHDRLLCMCKHKHEC